jgi:hypothetical protein
VGSLLTGHSDVAIAHELDALLHLNNIVHRYQLYSLLIQRDQFFTDAGRDWNFYNYSVPDLDQASYRNLRVIGDKKGGASTRTLAEKPELLDRLREIIEEDLRVIQVIRHPYDNIGSLSKTGRAKTVEEGIDIYFDHARGVDGISDALENDELFRVYHEDVIEDPKTSISKLCEFLGVTASDEYIRHSDEFVFDSPSLSRKHANWSDSAKETVRMNAMNHSWLDHYQFD